MKTYNLIATAAAGIESLVATELKQHGYTVQTENGKVNFQGNARDIACCGVPGRRGLLRPACVLLAVPRLVLVPVQEAHLGAGERDPLRPGAEAAH